MKYLISATIFFLLQSFSFSASVKDFTADYAVYKNDFYLGKSKRILTTEKNTLNFSSITETAGIVAWFFDARIVETSKLTLKKNSLHFYSYLYNEKSNDKHQIHQLHIDDSGQLYNSFTKQQYPLSQNMHDGLGFSIVMMHDLLKGKREITYVIAEKEALKTYHLKVTAEESISTKNGEINTLKIEHYNPQSKERFIFWCAESLGFLPVRVYNIKNNGDEVLLNLTHFNKKAIALDLDNDEFN